MNTLQAGFSRTVMTPPIGVPIDGYYFERIGDGVLDDLEINAVAFDDGTSKAVILSCDLVHIDQSRMDLYREEVGQACGIDPQAVFIHTTHTHTAPAVGHGTKYCSEWEKSFGGYLCTAAVKAFSDLAGCTVGVASGKVERVCFIRRYRMKDGSVQTNPGVNNPNIAEPIGQADETERIVRLFREGKPDIMIVNFQNHPDVIGGTKYSADWPKTVRLTVEAALDEKVRCVFLNGAEGDLNHVNVFPRPGESNGLEPDTFDGVLRGYEFSKNIGRMVAGEAIKLSGRTAPVNAVPLRYKQELVDIPSNRPTPEETVEAEKIMAIHQQPGGDKTLPYEGMELTTVVAEADRMVRLKDGPDSFQLNFSGLSFGDVALLGIPGEPFCEIGRQIREKSPFHTTLVCCLTNGNEGYFPMQDAYEEGGYESRSSLFKKGVGEKIVSSSVSLLEELK